MVSACCVTNIYGPFTGLPKKKINVFHFPVLYDLISHKHVSHADTRTL